VADDFSPEGQLAQAIPGFKPREPQRQMAHAVARAIDKAQPLVVEAGTGTGKTYAYLAPALRAKKKVIISTGSKALQDQLYSRDLPTVAKALKYKGRLALLKGRSNYLCLERLEQQALAGGDLPVQTLSDVIILRAWANQTEEGDISTCASVPEDSPAWPLVTSTNDNCLGSDCPLYKDCFVVKARKTAMDADVVVVNHHLFLADMVVKDSGFGELIPEADVMIFDEAHQLLAWTDAEPRDFGARGQPRRVEQAAAIRARRGTQPIDRGVADAARRHVDDAFERRVRGAVAQEAQVRDHVLDLFALEERHRADDLRRHVQRA